MYNIYVALVGAWIPILFLITSGQMLGAEKEPEDALFNGEVEASRLDEAFPGFLIVKFREGEREFDGFTDGRFCIIEADIGSVRWGYLRALKPLSVEWIGNGNLKQAVESYIKHTRTIYIGETSATALQKLRGSGLRDLSQKVRFENAATRRFKWQTVKWFNLDEAKLLCIRFIEYDGNIVVDDIEVIAAKRSERGDLELGAFTKLDNILLPQAQTKATK